MRIGPGTGRGRRYAQRCVVTASAAARLELRAARSHFVNFGKTTQDINMKTVQLHLEYVYKVEGRDFVTAGPLDKNEFRINVSKTIRENTNLKSERTRKRNFLTIH